MNEILTKLGEYGLVPVVNLRGREAANSFAAALLKAKLPVAEITLRNPSALDSIAAVSSNPEILTGAGTVLNAAQAESAVKAGAKFIVTPGFFSGVVDWCASNGVTCIPGCSNATDLTAAVESGLEAVKFFPAEASGGLDAINALSAPFPGVRFLPTGGINAENLVPYIKNDRVLCVGGSFMVDSAALESNDTAALDAALRSAIMAMFGFRLAHIGINLPDSASALSAAAQMNDMFGFSPTDGKLGVMCDGQFEFMKGPYFGNYGHIAVYTNTIERAMAYFKRLGYAFEENGILYNAEGRINAAYFKNDFSGCAIHLLRRP